MDTLSYFEIVTSVGMRMFALSLQCYVAKTIRISVEPGLSIIFLIGSAFGECIVIWYCLVFCVIRLYSPVNLVHLLCISNISMTSSHLTDFVASSVWFLCKAMCAFIFSLFIYSPLSLIGEVLLPFSLSVQIFCSVPNWGCFLLINHIPKSKYYFCFGALPTKSGF